jgi:ubiquitin carboxyl-terminal hydrolase 5/13
VASDWTPKKLNVEVQMPDTLDLESLRARGPQPGEQLQPEGPTGGTQDNAFVTLSTEDIIGLLPQNVQNSSPNMSHRTNVEV